MRIVILVGCVLVAAPAFARGKAPGKPDCRALLPEAEIEAVCKVKLDANGDQLHASADRCYQSYTVTGKRMSTAVSVTVAWGAHLASQKPADFLAREETLPHIEAFETLEGLGDAATRHDLVAPLARGEVREKNVRFIRGDWFGMLQSWANDGAVSLEPPCNADELVELGKRLDARFAAPAPKRKSK